MEVTALFAANEKEIIQAQQLELEEPELIEDWDDAVVNLKYVEFANRSTKGDIVLRFISGKDWTIKYNEMTWKKIVEALK